MISSAAGVLIVATVVTDLIGQYADKGATLHQISVLHGSTHPPKGGTPTLPYASAAEEASPAEGSCAKKENAWRFLWMKNNDPRFGSEELVERYRELKDQYVTEAAGEARIPKDQNLNQQCWESAIEAERNR